MRTVKSSGIKFNVVNELPTQARNKLLKTVNEFLMNGNDFDRVDNILNYIAGGACGRVYDLGDGLILKVNKFDWNAVTPDGDILKDLQGIPMIPKVYWYSEDNRFIVVQKIDGETTSSYMGDYLFKKRWEEEYFKQLAHGVDDMVKERGWVLNDVHGNNCMIDREGNFWIVDVGLFRKVDDFHFGDGLQDLLYEVEKVAFWHNTEYDKQVASERVA